LELLRYIEANPIRAKMARNAKNYEWSSFAHHGLGELNPLIAESIPYLALAKRPPTRQRKWDEFVHQKPKEEELAAIRRSNSTGLPFGNQSWINQLAQKLNLDLTIRPRGRPKHHS
jgi:putative transposase